MHQKMSASGRRVQGTLLVFFGALVLLGGIALGQGALRFRHQASGAGGVVAALVEQRVGSKPNLHAVVDYQAADGARGRFTDDFGSNPPAYHIGEAVRVLYDPASPSGHARIDRGAWDLLPSFIVLALGLLLAGTGVSKVRQAVRDGAAARLPSAEEAAIAVHPDPAPTWVERHATTTIIVLLVLGVALFFAPPQEKSGDAGTGIFLWLLGAVLALVRVGVAWVALPLLAGASAVEAVRMGAGKGLDAGAPMKEWMQAADASAGLRGLLLHYRDLRHGLLLTACGLLFAGCFAMGTAAVAAILR